MNWTIIGIIAGLFTTFGFVPQIIRGYKRKKLDDLSYYFLLIPFIGFVLWLSYGVAVRDIPIIMANIFTLSLSSTLIIMKYKYSSR